MPDAVVVIGKVNEYGYLIRAVDAAGDDVCEEYVAGNHKLDSHQVVPVGSRFCEDESDLFSMAIETAREVAEENGLSKDDIDVRYKYDW